MEAVLFMGVQATGKSTFFARRFLDTHLRLNMDMLGTRHRESVLLEAFIRAKARFVVDNTNPTRRERRRYIDPAKAAGYRIVGYYFSSSLAVALQRNAGRPEPVPEIGIRGTYARLELPDGSEGFDELYFVRLDGSGTFEVEDWQDEVR